MGFEPATFGLKGLNAPSGAGCSLTPASGSRVIATFPGAGSPPACGGPSGGGRNGSISTTFRWYDATRHRRPRERIRRRLWTRPCGKVAVGRGVPHHTDGDQCHRFGQPQPREYPSHAPAPHRSPRWVPVVEHEHRTTHARPAQDTHLPVSDPPEGGVPLPPEQDTRQRRTTSLGSSAQHQNKPSS